MLVDTNVLLYATFSEMPEHARVRAWLTQRLSANDGSLVLCWPVVYAFVRLITSPRVFGSNASTVRDGWAIAEAYLQQPGIRMIAPGARHAAIASELAAIPGLRSDDVPDVEIAALAIEHGLVLATHDRGFRRFDRLRVVDPLE